MTSDRLVKTSMFSWENSTTRRMLKGLVIAYLAVTIWRYAWISDDILITLRTSLNWAHGLGPVFNPGERVAGYTHPLWFLVLTGVGGLTGSWVYATLWLCIALSVSALAVIVGRSRNWWQFVVVTSGLGLSVTITDWSTSGLENPLAAVLLCAIFAVGPVSKSSGSGTFALLGVLCGLLLLTRLDFAILMAPWVLALILANRSSVRGLLTMAGSGAAVLAMWAIPSWAYYGYVLPATFAAKTNVDIPQGELLARGFGYLTSSLAYDPAAAALLIGLAVVAVVTRIHVLLVWMAGVAAYFAYVAWVGGDFMLGRFLYVPIIALLLAVTATDLPRSPPQSSNRRTLMWLVPVAVVVVGIPSAPGLSISAPEPHSPDKAPYADERSWWLGFGRALNPIGQFPDGPWLFPTELSVLEASANNWPEAAPPLTQERVLVACGGLAGYAFVQPQLFAVDQCGLTDRFLGSLPYRPPTDGTPWRAGHLERTLPEGYVDALVHNDPARLADPAQAERLRELWERIRP